MILSSQENTMSKWKQVKGKYKVVPNKAENRKVKAKRYAEYVKSYTPLKVGKGIVTNFDEFAK